MEKTKMNSRGDAISTTAGEDMSVDWKGRPCKPSKHGGMTAAVFVLGLSLSLFSLYISFSLDRPKKNAVQLL